MDRFAGLNITNDIIISGPLIKSMVDEALLLALALDPTKGMTYLD